MNRFPPTLESLDCRALPSAVAISPITYASSPLQVATESVATNDTSDRSSAEWADDQDSEKKTGGKTMKIRLSDILIVSYETKSSH